MFYPGNAADARPNVTHYPFANSSFRAGTDFIWRVSKRDALYAPPGIALVLGNGAGGSFVTAFSFLRSDDAPDAHLSFSISGVHGFANTVITSAGGRDFNYLGLSTDLHF